VLDLFSDKQVQALSGKLEAIWIKRMKRGPMDSVEHATLERDAGLVGNANQGRRRQVTIIEREVWERLMGEVGGALTPVARRANLLISGLSLLKSRKRILLIGRCRIRVLGENKPCERMEETLEGLEKAMWPSWGGGAFGEVLDDGEILVGDLVSWVEE